MQEFGRELTDLKREVVEARNQAIKTDNQVKNVALDVKTFEKRFDLLERRTRMASLGMNVIVAVVIVVASLLIYGVRSHDTETKLKEAREDAAAARAKAATETQALTERLSTLERAEEQRRGAEKIALEIINRLDARQEKEAAELLDKVNLDSLGPLAKEVAGKRLAEFRRRMAEAALRAGRVILAQGRAEAALPDLRRAIALDPDRKVVPQARYALATTLYNLKRFDEAVPLLREVLGTEEDKPTAEDARYQLATSLARLAERDEATKILKEIAAQNSRYSPMARNYLTALETGADLPPFADDRVKKAALAAPKPPVTPAPTLAPPPRPAP
ncbi:MAG: tetratricopeptide repeat protein [Deltaproteobacteria bacterium]|nr:tetratricopeptide repeat protein [Deltaproteobacteria bacterium]